MTDLLPAVPRAGRSYPCSSDCPGRSHGPSNRAWREGCRSTEAVAAHDQYLTRIREEARTVRAAGRRAGECLAAMHRTSHAIKRGCICVPAAPAGLRGLSEITRMLRKYRGPGKRVNRVNLLMLLDGLVDDPTQGEYVAAVAILRRRGRRSGTGLMTGKEIADRLGIDDRAVWRYMKQAEKLAGERTRRRLLESRLKAIRAANARVKAARRG